MFFLCQREQHLPEHFLSNLCEVPWHSS